MVPVYIEGLVHFSISYLCFQSLSVTTTEETRSFLTALPSPLNGIRCQRLEDTSREKKNL